MWLHESAARSAPGHVDSEPSARPRVVAIGGGTGLSVTLSGLKNALFARGGPPAHRDSLTAIVNVVDDGGSSGRLRRGLALPPPGDVRNCLLALADGDPTLAALFGYRFVGGGGIGGHSLGNLVMVALAKLGGGDFRAAVEHAARLLDVRGRVLPATVDPVVLEAEFTDGSFAAGESRIPTLRRRIRRVRLRPATARALPEVCAAVAAADLIVLGPGSLYTSIIPVLLLPGLADAIARSGAPVALVANLMTEPGETDNYSAVDMVRAIRRHAPEVTIRHVLVSRRPLPATVIDTYQAQGATPVRLGRRGLVRLGCVVVDGDFGGAGPLARHDPEKLAAAILALIPLGG
jgi:uncharacterized cofD-like protein